MLPELHDVLQKLIYARGRIGRDVDITFEAPRREWTDKLVRPTVNLYLFELVENTGLRQAQFRSSRRNGKQEVRAAPRRVDLRYVVSALTTDSDDAFRLLWRVLGALMREPDLTALFPEQLDLGAQVVARVAQPDSGIKLLDVWSALGAEPRTSFCYEVTLPVDLELVFEADFVVGRTFAFDSLTSAGGPESVALISGIVRDSAGKPVQDVTIATIAEPHAGVRTDATGAFTFRTIPPDAEHPIRTVPVRVTRPNGWSKTMDIVVPSPEYDLLVE